MGKVDVYPGTTCMFYDIANGHKQINPRHDVKVYSFRNGNMAYALQWTSNLHSPWCAQSRAFIRLSLTGNNYNNNIPELPMYAEFSWGVRSANFIAFIKMEGALRKLHH
ncbi:hypothetical protein JHK86_000855 [Glycine max]|nr:hypothetical protein JHK86_000855 [Glycine max]